MFYFSQDLVTILKSIENPRRREITAAIRTRLKSPDVYRTLMFTLGLMGLHRLYLQQTGSMWLRINYFTAAMVGGFFGVFYSNYLLLGSGAALSVVVLGLWIYDLFTTSSAIKSYHKQIEYRVLSWYNSVQVHQS